MRLPAALAAATVVGTLVLASPSEAMVTIGPNLASLTPAPGGFNCSSTDDCTLVNGSVGAGFGSSQLVSPVSGYIAHLRVRTGPGGSGYFDFRQLRPVGGAYRSVLTFGVVNPPLPPNSTIDFPGFPIHVGDAIGVDCCRGGGDNITSDTVPGSGNFLLWNPLLGNNETRAPNGDHPDQLLMLNADIEPENNFLLDKARVKAKRVLATATVPNAGVLTIGSKLLRRTTIDVAAPAPGQDALFSSVAPLSVKTTKAGRARIRRAGKLKLTVTYTPIFGTSRSLKVTAKR